jgi:hypothetical protein
MNLDLVYTICFSDYFVSAWRDALLQIFKYKTYYNFVIVPNILGNKTYNSPVGKKFRLSIENHLQYLS